jgi:RNA polymerase sigma-70 factor (ECF subfamily)
VDDPGRIPDRQTVGSAPPVADIAAQGPVGATEISGDGPDVVERTPNELNAIRDRALVGQALEGDLEAFNRIVELYQDYLFALVVRMLADREAAADVVQEAFFSCYRNLSRFHGDSFRSWITRIALNAATDVLRLRKRRPADPYPEWEDDSWQPPAPESDNPERTAVRNARGRALSTALGQVTGDQRRAIVLYDVEGFDYQEIADMTGVSLGTVKSRIHRGRLALRDLLGDKMELFRD